MLVLITTFCSIIFSFLKIKLYYSFGWHFCIPLVSFLCLSLCFFFFCNYHFCTLNLYLHVLVFSYDRFKTFFREVEHQFLLNFYQRGITNPFLTLLYGVVFLNLFYFLIEEKSYLIVLTDSSYITKGFKIFGAYKLYFLSYFYYRLFILLLRICFLLKLRNVFIWKDICQNSLLVNHLLFNLCIFWNVEVVEFLW